MDFSAPYRTITPTLDGPVLRALAGVDTALTRAQVVKLVEKASEAGVRKTLARLVGQGIVIEERTGSRYAYRVNRDHLLWPSLEGLFNARGLLRDRVREFTSEWEPKPVSVELFGSVAQGTADESSDIDILIIRPDLEPDQEDDWEQQVGDLRDNVVRWTGNSCDVIVMGGEQLRESDEQDEPILRSPRSNLAGLQLDKLRSDLWSDQVHKTTEVFQRATQKAVLRYQMPKLADAIATSSATQQTIARIAASFVTANLNLAEFGVKPEALTKLVSLPTIDNTVTRQISGAARAIESGRTD